jgi:hypothetical protein
MSRTYGRMTCLVCKKSISAAGGGIRHMRMHEDAGDERAIRYFRERESVRRACERIKMLRGGR